MSYTNTPEGFRAELELLDERLEFMHINDVSTSATRLRHSAVIACRGASMEWLESYQTRVSDSDGEDAMSMKRPTPPQSQPPRTRIRGSSEATRLSFLTIISFCAAVLSGFYAVTIDGYNTTRLVLTALAGGWTVMLMLAVTQMPRQPQP